MSAKEFYKELHWFPGVEMKTKYDKQANIFDYHDLIDFATQFAESQKKELIEKLEIIHKQMQNKQYKTSRISLGILLHCLETPLEKYKQL